VVSVTFPFARNAVWSATPVLAMVSAVRTFATQILGSVFAVLTLVAQTQTVVDFRVTLSRRRAIGMDPESGLWLILMDRLSFVRGAHDADT
jgi:hypothetical protein